MVFFIESSFVLKFHVLFIKNKYNARIICSRLWWFTKRYWIKIETKYLFRNVFSWGTAALSINFGKMYVREVTSNWFFLFYQFWVYISVKFLKQKMDIFWKWKPLSYHHLSKYLATNQNWYILIWLYSRCGRVMADNIAYAKFRKSLLIW